MKTYTVLIPAPKGTTGGVPYHVHTDKGEFQGNIPFDKQVTGVVEPVVGVLKQSYPDGVYTPEQSAAPTPKEPDKGKK